MEGMMLKCDRCGVILFDPHFSCMPCLGKSPHTFDLCSSCYSNGGLSHEHSTDHMAFIKSTSAQQKSHRKKEMEELQEIAKAHFRAGSPQLQALAHRFYESMDTDGDGRVNIHEFFTFMRETGSKNLQNPHFFQDLDLDGNGTLDFFEVMAIFYIIKSGRPFCDGCQKFIPGIYFSCAECFNIETSFDLCRDCYQSTKCSHNHNGRVLFLDNYTMLRTERDSALAQLPIVNSNPAWSTSSYASISQTPSYSNAIVPTNNERGIKWKHAHQAYQAFEIGFTIGSIAIAAVALCTIM